MTIYTLECIVKIIARGFFVDQMSYVRDPWNLVDLFVVGLGYIMQIIDLVSPYIMKATQEKLYRFYNQGFTWPSTFAHHLQRQAPRSKV